MAAPALLLRGGRVLDPAQGLDATLDVRLREGRVDAVGPDLDATGCQVQDVRGLLVVPGLIDAHVHCFKGIGGNSLAPDLLGVSRGVTTVVDAGSSGHSAFGLFRDHIMAEAKTRVLAYLNLSTVGGVMGPHFARLGDPRFVEPEGIAAVVGANRDRIVGMKWMATNSSLGGQGLEPLRRGRAIADELSLPVLVHVGESWGDGPHLAIEEVVELLRPGDTITHMYTSHRGGLLDAAGRLVPAVREARDRGVLFDIGHGANNLSFDVAQRLLDQDFPPDAVSTDGSGLSVRGPVYDLPTTMSKLLALGVPLADVVAMATSQAAALLGRADDLGSLAVGREADVTVLRLDERDWTALDSRREPLTVHQQLVPVFAVRAGEVVYPRPPDGP
jgi:dihydroorotase